MGSQVFAQSNEPSNTVDGLIRQAEAAEKKFHYDEALRLYHKVLQVDDGHWHASTARTRIHALSQHQTDFSHLQTLEQFRTNTRAQDDFMALSELAERTKLWAPTRARDDVMLMVVEAFLRRVKRPEVAADYALWIARGERMSVDGNTRNLAYELALQCFQNTRNLKRLKADLVDDLFAPDHIRRLAAKELRRQKLHWVAYGCLGAAILTWLLVVSYIASRRLWKPLFSVFKMPLLWIALTLFTTGAFLIARYFEHVGGEQLLFLGGAFAIVHLWLSCVRTTLTHSFLRKKRTVRMFAVFQSFSLLFALAYLILEEGQRRGNGWLEGFGL